MLQLLRFLLSFVFIFSLGANEVSNKLINLSQANHENPTITGTGVVIGILDGVFNPKNPVLAGKHVGLINSEIKDPGRFVSSNKIDMTHGSQVASIIVAGHSSMKGVAPDARYYGFAYSNPNSVFDTRNTLAYKKTISSMIDSGAKIFNHSYVSSEAGFPLINRTFSPLGYLANSTENLALTQSEFQALKNTDVSLVNAQILADLSKERDILNIVGAGNDGFISNRANSVLPSYDESYRELIVVGGVNAHRLTKVDNTLKFDQIKDEQTKQTIKTYADSLQNNQNKKNEILQKILTTINTKQGIFASSNFFYGSSSLYGVLAPAQGLKTANGRYGYPYYTEENNYKPVIDDEIIANDSHGTSFATPYASGVAALVQQKYPFLTARQIADVILTTANKNIELPKLLVMNNLTTTAYYFYSIIYVDNEVPKKSDGTFDFDRIKKDLKDAGFSISDNDDQLAEYIIEHLLKTDDDNAKKQPNSVAISRLSKQEVIAQGVLDAQNALKGLASLNVNRLNPSDIQQFYGKHYAFYTINTQGKDSQYAFTNDISETKWDEKYHLNDALNSLKTFEPLKDKLDTLEAGFEKTGAGVFVFSNNTLHYNGPTLVRGGTLRFDNVTAKDTTLYADAGGRIEITGNNNHASRQLYAINGGEVQISGTLASGDVYAQNGGIIGGKGTITQNLQNDSGVVFAGFMPDTDSINGGEKLSISGKYTQDNKGKLIIGFNKTSPNSAVHTDLSAKTYEIKGGILEILPVYSSQRIQSGDKLKLNLAFLENNANFDNIEVADTRTLRITFDKNTQIISAELKPDALKAQNMSQSMSSAIHTIYNDTQGKQEYDSFFKQLDFVDEQTFTQALDSITESPTLSNLSDELNTQQSNNFAALGYILTPTDSMRSHGRIRLSAAGDLRNVLAGLFGRANRQQMTINTSYSKIKHTDYTAGALSTNLQYKNRVYDNLILGVFADYTRGSASHTYAERSGSTYTLGASAIYDMRYFSLLSTASAGVGSNIATRSILGAGTPSKIQAKYTTTTYFAQLGISKDIALGRLLTLKPMALASISGISQGGYEERGGLFALRREAQSYAIPGAALGAHAIYGLPIGASELHLSLFGFYTMRFLDSIHSRASFKDFENSQHFIQTASLSVSSVYAGLNAQWQYSNYFARLGGSIESTRIYTLINGTLSIGLYF